MKTAFFFDVDTDGGGILQQTRKYIDSTLKLEIDRNRIIIIVNSKKISFELSKNNIDHLFFNKKNFLIRLLFILYRISFFRFFFNKYNILNPFENYLKKNSIDLVIFNSPSYYIFYSKKINYIINIWNTEIKNYNFFPEFKKKLAYEHQNKIIKEAVDNAFRIIVFTKQNKKDLENIYNCNSKKIIEQIMIPNLPKIYEENINHDFNSLFNYFKIKLKDTKLFLYPAQYFPHKNHKFLIDAVNILKKKTVKKFIFIFTGIDKGNLSFLKNLVNSFDLNKEIIFYENLDDKKLISLYLKCDALISSTYLGRISLPLLEAFYFEKPIFYSEGILDMEFEKKVYPFDLKSPLDLMSKLISFLEGKEGYAGFINSNKNYYNLNCTDKNFNENYLKIINEYEFYSGKWKK